MDLSLTETQEMLRRSIQQLLAKELTWDRVRDTQGPGAGDEALWKSLGAVGWTSLAFPESMGGGGADLLDVAVAVEEVARSAAVVPLLETLAGSYAVSRFGDPAVGERLAADVREAAAAVAPAIGSPDVAEAEPTVTDGRLSGTRRYVDYAGACDRHLVAATADGEPALYLIEADGPEVTQEPLLTVGRLPQAHVTYRSVGAVRAGDVRCVTGLAAVATLLTCAQLLGYAQVALDMTVNYVRDRSQFGRALGTFQAVQHHCADMATAVEATRYITYETIWKFEAGRADANDVAVAKAVASHTGVFATMQAHQLHGGMGMTEEFPCRCSVDGPSRARWPGVRSTRRGRRWRRRSTGTRIGAERPAAVSRSTPGKSDRARVK